MGALKNWIRRKHSGSTLAGVLFFDFCRVWGCRIPISIFFRPLIRGLENVPKTGPVLIVSNHQSYIDPPLVGCFVSFRQFDFIARGGLFTNKFFGKLIKALHSISVAEDAPDTAAIKAAIARLKQGGAVLIFPEGSRTFDGTLGEFKRGAELLLRKGKCPVVPVAIEGVYDAWPRGGKPRFFGSRIAISYGKPIPAEELLDKSAEVPPLERIASWIDSERLELRAALREKTKGKFPPTGPADQPRLPGA